MTAIISVPERGAANVDARTWRALATDETFWSLVDRKIINVSPRRDGSATLKAGNSVGFARCGEVTLRVREKVSGTLEALFSRRLTGLRTVALPGEFAREGAFVEQIVVAFTAAVKRYVTSGRDWTYERVQRQGSVIGGRLLVPETLALRARGRPQLAVFDKRQITHVTPVNQCIAAALRITEELYDADPFSDLTIAGARALGPFFHDSSTREVLFGAPTLHAQRAAELADQIDGDTGELLHLAAVLLSGAGLNPLADPAGRLPITWFINLEDAFEAGVRYVLHEHLSATWTVEKGGDQAYLFPAVEHLNVTPDLVLTERASQVRFVGDVKYKSLGGAPGAADLYQLLAHATSLGSQRSFLVYPSDTFRHLSLGVSATGVAVDVFAVNLRDIQDGTARIVDTLLQ